jgi:hypothetical protein
MTTEGTRSGPGLGARRRIQSSAGQSSTSHVPEKITEPTATVSLPARTLQPAAGLTAALNFIRPQDAKPVFHSAALTGEAPKLFFEMEAHTVTIMEMRDIADTLSLDHEGFRLLKYPTAVADLYDDAAIKQIYYPEIQALLRRELGATEVEIFDVTRRSDRSSGAPNPDGLRGPATRVHVDYTVNSGPQRVRDVFGDFEADRLAARGTRIVEVNVWRPIRGPVERSPPALADASSVQPGGLVATDQIFPNRVGEIYHLAYAPQQRWYYASRMTSDEVILIKGWDTVDDGRARFTPHCGFTLPQTRAGAPPRESIEVRTLAVFA